MFSWISAEKIAVENGAKKEKKSVVFSSLVTAWMIEWSIGICYLFCREWISHIRSGREKFKQNQSRPNDNNRQQFFSSVHRWYIQSEFFPICDAIFCRNEKFYLPYSREHFFLVVSNEYVCCLYSPYVNITVLDANISPF